MTETIAEPRQPETWVSTDPGIVTWRTFLQAHATVIRRIEADLESEGQLSLADLDVLIQLARAEGHRLRMSELAEVVLLSRSGMTRRIDRLEASGLVRRHECAADRRGSYAAITETGLDRLREARPVHLRGIDEHFVSRLTADDLAALSAVLAKIVPLDDRPGRQELLTPPSRPGEPRPLGTLYAGTSGFAYPAWSPAFYPPGSRADDLLRFYAARLPACELNNTFYQRPTEAKVRSWLAATPPEFRFAVKGQRGATMRALLQDAPGSVAWLTESIRPFGERLGTVLYRVPEDVQRTDERLAALLDAWPRDLPLTMEFQHPSWLIDEVFDLLRQHGATVCATELDTDPEPPTLRLTGRFLYVRLRRSTYTEAEIEAWAMRFVPFLDAGHDVFVFFRHDDEGLAPGRAMTLRAAVARARPADRSAWDRSA